MEFPDRGIHALTGVQVFSIWIFGRIWCSIWLAVDVWTCTASILHLVVISLDRYIAVTHPITYPNIMTSKRAKMLILAAWVLRDERTMWNRVAKYHSRWSTTVNSHPEGSLPIPSSTTSATAKNGDWRTYKSVQNQYKRAMALYTCVDKLDMGSLRGHYSLQMI